MAKTKITHDYDTHKRLVFLYKLGISIPEPMYEIYRRTFEFFDGAKKEAMLTSRIKSYSYECRFDSDNNIRYYILIKPNNRIINVSYDYMVILGILEKEYGDVVDLLSWEHVRDIARAILAFKGETFDAINLCQIFTNAAERFGSLKSEYLKLEEN